MRTTLTIDDDVLAAAKELAAAQDNSVGEVFSALTRRALLPVLAIHETRNGVPLLAVRPRAVPLTPAVVSQLHDRLP